jgi:acyl carrier protein
MDRIIDFLWNYLNEIKPLEMSKEEFLKYRYLDNHLDSFEIIQFILAIENEFNITLNPEDTESEEIRTIEGLAKIIEGKL